jgi:class 3 adenylate cyclase
MEPGEEIPETKFATLGDDRIAYQAFGHGDVDLIYVPGSGECMDLRWYWPSYAKFLRGLGAHARVITFDRGGSGGSEAPSGDALPSWERWADEARVVLDAVASERAVIFAQAPGSGPIAILFAVSHPARTSGLILANTSARYEAAADYPGGAVPADVAARWVERSWGTEAVAEFACPDASRDPAFRRWMAMTARLAMTPKKAGTAFRFELSIDARESLSSVRVPTLVLHRDGYTGIPQAHSRYMAEHISGARFALVPGNDGALHTEPIAEALQEIEEFLRGLHGPIEPDRALAAILFTDIVGSTAWASALGDRAWRNLLESHDVLARTVVDQHRGKLVKMTGDGMLATFDGPGRAIRCAIALGDALRPLGLEIRAGLHTGEVELRGTDIAGIGVHIAARVLAAAQPGDLLVSAAVPMLVAGSGFEFEDRGEHDLKGLSGTWRLFAVEP